MAARQQIPAKPVVHHARARALLLLPGRSVRDLTALSTETLQSAAGPRANPDVLLPAPLPTAREERAPARRRGQARSGRDIPGCCLRGGRAVSCLSRVSKLQGGAQARLRAVHLSLSAPDSVSSSEHQLNLRMTLAWAASKSGNSSGCTQAAMISSDSTRRGPGRLKKALPSLT